MKTTHTPGPWTRFGCTIYRENQRVADTWNPESPFLPVIAISNAILIASAPELLSALEAMTKAYVELVESDYAPAWNAENDKEVISARAIIAKAKGEL